jgi:hypothetical protein
MNVVSSHEMSKTNCLKFDAYTFAKRDPWQIYCSLVVNMCSLFESPNMALKSSKNVSKSLSKGDWHSNKGVNQARVVLNQSLCRGIQLGLSWSNTNEDEVRRLGALG